MPIDPRECHNFMGFFLLFFYFLFFSCCFLSSLTNCYHTAHQQQIALDGLFFLLCIMSACLAAKKCDEKTEQIAAASSFEVCKFDGDDARTSIVSFAFHFFFLSILYCPPCPFSSPFFLRWWNSSGMRQVAADVLSHFDLSSTLSLLTLLPTDTHPFHILKAFMFFTSFAFAFSIYYSVQEYRGVPPGGWFCIYPCYDLFDIPRPGQKNEGQQSSV